VAVHLVRAADGAHNLRTPRANQPDKTEDFASFERKGDILQLVRIERTNLQQRFSNAVRPFGVFVFNRASDHLCDHVRAGQVPDRLGIDHVPVAHDGNDVAKLENLIQLVADVDDGNALFLQVMDDLEELLELVAGERTARLVHDDELGVERERFRNLHHLLFGGGEIADQLAGVDRTADAVQ
jgi:hypothetical protein